MKIKNKLLFIAGISALAIIVLSIFLYFSLRSYSLAIEKNGIADQITYNIFENNSLLGEYLLYPEDRPRDLWFNKNDRTVALIKSKSTKFSKASEKEIINNLLTGIGKNQKTFLELIASREEGSMGGAEQQARLSAQILINNQEAVFSAGQLAVASEQDADIAQKTVVYFLVGFVALIFIIVSVILYFIWLSIVEPLIKLKEVTVRIASLDFTATADETSNDEMGQLARAYNSMTLKLKESYRNLDASNQQLKASNQQLDASTQQLRAANQQLTATGKELKEKMADVEVFNKAMIGRELKMIELKKEIEELKKIK